MTNFHSLTMSQVLKSPKWIKEVNSDNAESARLPLRSYKSEDEMIEEVEKLLRLSPSSTASSSTTTKSPQTKENSLWCISCQQKTCCSATCFSRSKADQERAQAAVGSFQTQSREKVPRPIHQPRHHSRRIEDADA